MYQFNLIQNLKQHVCQKYKIRRDDQVILFKGRKLDDSEKLITLFLEEKSPDLTLSLNLIVQEKAFEIRIINMITTDSLFVAVKSSDTIVGLKKQLEEKTDLPYSETIIIEQRSDEEIHLEDDRQVSDYDFDEYTVLVLYRVTTTIRLHIKDTGEIKEYQEAGFKPIWKVLFEVEEKYDRQIIEMKDGNGIVIDSTTLMDLNRFYELNIFLCDAKLKLKFLTKVEEFKMSNFQSIKCLKRYIAQEYKFFPQNQIIFFKGRKVEDSEELLTLFREENSPDCTLSLDFVVDEKPIEVIVKDNFNKDEFTLNVNGTDTIADLKKLIEENTGFPSKYTKIDSPRLKPVSWNYRITLKDEKTYAEYIGTLGTSFSIVRFFLISLHYTSSGKTKDFKKKLRSGYEKTVEELVREITKEYRVRVIKIKDQNNDHLNMDDTKNLLVRNFHELHFYLDDCA